MLCEPQIDGHGGVPAGLQIDKNGDLWVADMRLGILHVKPDGSMTQVNLRKSLTFFPSPLQV